MPNIAAVTQNSEDLNIDIQSLRLLLRAVKHHCCFDLLHHMQTVSGCNQSRLALFAMNMMFFIQGISPG